MSRFFEDVAADKAEKRATLLSALAGQPDPPAATYSEPEKPPTVSFDGGARRDQPAPPPSEGEFYAELFGSTKSQGPAPEW